MTMAATSDGEIWRPEDRAAQVGQLGRAVAAGALAPGADAREGRVVDHRHQRTEAGSLLDLRVREAQRAHGAAVEPALEGDDPGPMGVVARQLDGALDASVPELVRKTRACSANGAIPASRSISSR